MRDTRDGDVLLLHGFTGLPSHLDSLRDALAGRGYRVLAPLLPGHGTSARDLRRTRWRDWYRAAEEALAALGPRVAIAGLSMGSLLAILLAARHADRVSALALLSTPLWLPPRLALTARLVSPWLPYYPKLGLDVRDPRHRANVPGYGFFPMAAVRSLMELMTEAGAAAPNVRAPALVVHAVQDHTAPIGCADALEKTLGGPVHRLTLEESFHVVTLDLERDRVAETVVDFFQEAPP